MSIRQRFKVIGLGIIITRISDTFYMVLLKGNEPPFIIELSLVDALMLSERYDYVIKEDLCFDEDDDNPYE